MKGLLNVPVVHVWIDLHVLQMDNFERRVLRREHTTTTVHCRSACKNYFVELIVCVCFF